MYREILAFLTAISILLLPQAVVAQETEPADPVATEEVVAPPQDPPPMAAKEAADKAVSGDLRWSGEIRLTLIIFIFGLIALGMFYFLHRTGNATPYVLRIYVIIILVFGTLLVVSSAYATDQIAPVVGFFGTIAGYLVGRSENEGKKEPKT